MCLVFVATIAYCLNLYFDSMLRYEAIGAARFAALADVTLAEAELRSSAFCASMPAIIEPQCRVGISDAKGLAVSEFSFTPLQLLGFSPRRVTINAAATLEFAK